MADELTPTYRETTEDGVHHFTCLVPDAGHESGVCDHEATDFELFTQHMNQRHGGVMVAEPEVKSPPKPAPATAAAPRRAASQTEERPDVTKP